MRHARQNRARIAAGLLTIAGVLAAGAPPDGRAAPEPGKSAKGAKGAKGAMDADSGLVETVRVSLILLDVEVADERGGPIRGLKKEDFRVTLNGKTAEIYSVDDFCESAGPGEAAPPPGRKDSTTSVAPNTSVASKESEAAGTPAAVKLVLYFDFGLLRSDGRAHAIREAKRWISESMRDGDPSSRVA
ncbi:MAG: hypothetical protein DMF49_06710 [Acidobacteria bacterium]|nr:MAG: hypothetical protein DMF49_06710 [Acidobacteriota bacterium]